jgi:hypothetical protein
VRNRALVSGWLFCAACAAGSPRHVDSISSTAGDAADDTADGLGPESSTDDAGRPEVVVGTASDASVDELELAIADEPPYSPGARQKPKGAMAASNDDDLVARWNRGGPDVGAAPNGKAPHPAPRVKVDVVQVRGRIDEADVLRLARAKGYWPFRLCFEDGLKRAPKLHGTVTMRVTVGANGAPRGVRKVGAEVDDPLVVSCILKAARALSLPSPQRGTPEVTLQVSLWPGDAPLRSTPPPRVSPEVPGALVASLREKWPQVRACYAEGVRRRPGLWGRLAMRFRVTTAGQIVEASEIESHFPDRDVTECTLRAYERAGLAASGEERVIVYALRLGAPPP